VGKLVQKSLIKKTERYIGYSKEKKKSKHVKNEYFGKDFKEGNIQTREDGISTEWITRIVRLPKIRVAKGER